MKHSRKGKCQPVFVRADPSCLEEIESDRMVVLNEKGSDVSSAVLAIHISFRKVLTLAGRFIFNPPNSVLRRVYFL